MEIQCTLRSGETSFMLDGFPYKFKANEKGDFVCAIVKKDHIDYLIKRHGFAPYGETAYTEAAKLSATKKITGKAKERKKKGQDDLLFEEQMYRTRYEFTNLTVKQVAEAYGITERKVKEIWRDQEKQWLKWMGQ